MKQTIKKEQWDELSDEQKRKLLKIMKLDNLTQISYWHDSNESIFEYYKMNIGRMIEFLGDDLKEISALSGCVDNEGNTYSGWAVKCGQKNIEIFKEPCDALWETVKQKLI